MSPGDARNTGRRLGARLRMAKLSLLGERYGFAEL